MKKKIVGLLAALACAVPVMVQAASAPHLTSNAIKCDDGSFGIQGMFSQFVNDHHHIIWVGGGTNPKFEGDEWIGLRLNGAGTLARQFTMAIQADRNLFADGGSLISYVINDGGIFTTVTRSMNSLPSAGIFASKGVGNTFNVTFSGATAGTSGLLFDDIYFADESSGVGVPFSDSITDATIDGVHVIPDVVTPNQPLEDCGFFF